MGSVHSMVCTEQVRVADFDNDDYIRHYGVAVSTDMTELYGRVLDPPKLLYGGRHQVS